MYAVVNLRSAVQAKKRAKASADSTEHPTSLRMGIGMNRNSVCSDGFQSPAKRALLEKCSGKAERIGSDRSAAQCSAVHCSAVQCRNAQRGAAQSQITRRHRDG
jgi:hypothetical protein